MSHDSQIIAQLMCDITRDLVWPHVQAITKSHGHVMSGQLSARVGSGQKTYHQLSPVNGRYTHKIIYGKKMVEQKKDYAFSKIALSGREIINKNFYKGDLTYPNLIGHTVLHESGHAIQTVIEKRFANEVHNKHFYAVLEQLHEACGLDTVRELESRAQRMGVSLEFDHTSYDLDEHGQKKFKSLDIEHHQVVAVDVRGDRCLGVITKAGKEKSDVLFYAGIHAGVNFIGSNRLFKELGPDDRLPDPEKDFPKDIPWAKGDYCHFYDGKKQLYGGHIERANPKVCKVKVTEGPSSDIGKNFGVPRSMLYEGNQKCDTRKPKHPQNGLSF